MLNSPPCPHACSGKNNGNLIKNTNFITLLTWTQEMSNTIAMYIREGWAFFFLTCFYMCIVFTYITCQITKHRIAGDFSYRLSLIVSHFVVLSWSHHTFSGIYYRSLFLSTNMLFRNIIVNYLALRMVIPCLLLLMLI